MGYATLHSVYIVTVLIVTSGVLASAQAESCDTQCNRCTFHYDCCFHMNEEQEEPVFVGSATVHPSYDPSSNFTFQLNEGPDIDYRENFTVNSGTGDIRTTQLNIDVDNSEIRCIRILIQVSTSGVMLWTFAVEIDDINDNAPEFQADDITISVDEGPAEAVVVCGSDLRATDRDLEVSTNANITYSITGGDSANFTMHDTTTPCIRNIVELDRDTASSDPYTLSFTLEARDAGVAEVRSASTTITIEVQDINDNAPGFADSSPDLTVPENTPVNYTIVSFEAIDRDAGTNGELRYEIVSPPEGLPFEINSATGGLRLIKQLDWEISSGREFSFIIRATDMGVSPMFGTADVMVTVSDVNEKIVINFNEPEGNMVTVSENDTIDQVLQFEVVDDDDSDNKDNKIRFLSGGEYFSFRAFFNLFQVYQNGSIDREDMEMLILSIEFVQGGRPKFSDIINITVNVLDINDNYPELNQTSFEVVENEHRFTQITELGLFARDRDKDENGTIVSYKLISVRNDMKFKDLTEVFLMTNANNIPSNGLLLAPMLDREEDGPLLNVTMNLTDGGGNSALLSFTVEILDLNDQAPNFTQSSYEFHIPEEESNLVAGEVTARDDDNGLNGTITYRLEQPSDDFMINSTTGEIVTSPNKTFNREETPSFTLYVTASDNGTPPNPANSSVEVVIVIDDINDNSPEFDESQTSFTVQSDADVGTLIGQVVATDKDVGSNAEIRYKIEPSNHFSINLTTGHISVSQPLTTEEVFNLTVTAYNVVNPGDRSTPLDITITVTPASSSSETSIVVVTSGAISVVMAVVVLLTLLLVIWCCCCQKRKGGVLKFSRSPSSLNNGETRKGIMRPPVNSITGGTLRVTFKEEVVKRVYDVGRSVNSDTLDTESAINLDSSDESQTPPRIRQNGNIHTSEGLLNGVPGHTNIYTQQPRQRAPFVRMIQDVPNPELELSEGSITDEQNNFDGNSDEESNFSSDDASNVNVSLPIFEEHHMRYPPPLHHHPPSYKQPYSPSHISSPMAVSSLLPHAHMHVDVHNSGSLTLTPPHSHHSNSLSSHTPTPPYHQILASLASSSHHPMHTLSSSRNYPAVMPDAFGTPVLPLPTHYTPSFDYDYTSTYASTDLDEELKFNDTEPGFCSLTATDVYSDEESDSQL